MTRLMTTNTMTTKQNMLTKMMMMMMMITKTMTMMMITKMMMTAYPISSSASLPGQQASCAHLQVFNKDINS